MPGPAWVLENTKKSPFLAFPCLRVSASPRLRVFPLSLAPLLPRSSTSKTGQVLPDIFPFSSDTEFLRILLQVKCVPEFTFYNNLGFRAS
jgi:hypothetical protein